ncbi:RagB/SusD family nutrient uptake outer membrane protein [Dysgonomonas sp. 25]|uniref:RagB/SusD family nutrient uptake outer membrane protein n=1 Tax=Dysgonomonas sp. 25 TaxID=2302933 RepID=UPI0013D3F097|nr:RagB/SusD family nutrient uptake outer membrane protein [Dysgonomonas sp. 25]NDV70254.1 RagB/SusD family nutrient uptake outer membrane protein [Dysgonomonas sp. 25]
MKKILLYGISAGCLLLASCSLDKDPISDYSEVIIGEEGSDSIKYATRAEMLTQYEGMYSILQGNNTQEKWYMDYLEFAEVRADNAYAGGTSNGIVSLEQHSQDGDNTIVLRNWKMFLENINAANIIICNVDLVPDLALTQTERQHWKAEAKILRAWMMFEMVRLWGEVPVLIEETPQITADNIEEIYPLLFPERRPVDEVYAQIIEDLTDASLDAPAVDNTNKFKLTKAVANALLAKVYAEKPVRDYSKVIQYCTAVEADGFTLMPNYSDLFSVNAAKTDVNYRNTPESIFEVVYPQGSGNWVTWMFGIDLCDPSSTYNWAKWVTPSRDLVKAYEDEGDMVRMNEAIVWGQPSWSIYYPSNHYPFMYKTRSRFNSIIKLRLADILLLKAEAYVATNNLPAAVALVNQVRTRAGLSGLPSSVTGSQDRMKDAVLKERRLELAYEGQRWFDLVRNDKVINVVNTLPSRDSGRLTIKYPLTEETILLPIPQEEMDKNPNLTQNPGY